MTTPRAFPLCLVLSFAGAAGCAPARPAAPPTTPPSAAAPESTRAAAPEVSPVPPSPARLDSAPPAPAPGRRDPFEGADLSPKPPVLPLSPGDQRAKFVLPPGWRMEPVLTEPAIQQPATIAFDGDGRMYVLELRTYMLDADATNQLAPVNRISRWEDRNGDGVYETGTVFADSLVFPRFVTPIGANAILTMESNADEVYKLTDTNGDGRADRRELFTANFGRSANVEHMQSSLFWALDNWLYSTVNAFRVRWTPKGVLREPTGYNSAQWGASQDDDGKVWFQGGASGVPSYFQLPIAYGNYAAPEQMEKGFDEIWGLPLGLADVQGGMGIVRMPDGALARATAGSGANVYRGHRLPRDLLGDYFYGEVVGRVVRRVRPVKTDGLTQIRNYYQPEKGEFVRSWDPLFRPVEIKSAPDGSMYVVDMYHGVIQESQWTPKGSYLRAKIEQYQMDRIVGLGRIWRLTHDSIPRDTARPRMLRETPARLVRHLRHESGWWRDMAQQLLVLKQDRSVVPALRAMARRDTMPLARVHALWTLEGLGALDAALARALMRDPSPRLRVQAIRASETPFKAGDTTLAADWRRLTSDPDADVAIQAMLTLDTRKVPGTADVVRAAVAASPRRGPRIVGERILNPPPLAGLGAGNTPLSPAHAALALRGAALYRETCAQCHGETGEGTPVSAGSAETVAPALAGSPRVAGHRDWVLRTLLNGLTGPIEGRTYAGQIMVAQSHLPDSLLAAVATYIRTSFTNNASAITPEQVAAARAATAGRTTPWTFDELAASVPVMMRVQASWKATASHAPENAERALDTRGWVAPAPQAPGMWWQVELPEPATLAEVYFASSPVGPAPPAGAPPRPVPFPRGWAVQVSMDGETWSEPVATGEGKGTPVTITFAPVRAKFVRITQTGSAEGVPWAMQQLRLWEMRRMRGQLH